MHLVPSMIRFHLWMNAIWKRLSLYDTCSHARTPFRVDMRPYPSGSACRDEHCERMGNGRLDNCPMLWNIAQCRIIYENNRNERHRIGFWHVFLLFPAAAFPFHHSMCRLILSTALCESDLKKKRMTCQMEILQEKSPLGFWCWCWFPSTQATKAHWIKKEQNSKLKRIDSIRQQTEYRTEDISMQQSLPHSFLVINRR